MLEAVLEQILQPLLLQNTTTQMASSPPGFAPMDATATDDIIDWYIQCNPNKYLAFLRLSPSEIEQNIHQHELALARINQQQMEFS